MMHGRDLHKLGRELAEELDSSADPYAVTRARARLFSEAAVQSPASGGRGWAFAGLGLAGAAAVTAMIFVGKGSPPAPAAKVDPVSQLVSGVEVTASEGKPVPLVLEDDARFELAPGATVQMEPTRAGGTPWLVIGRGTVEGQLAEPARWGLRTGPVDLRFSPGSEFSVSWQPEDRVLVVHMISGRAELEGAIARPVATGERLRADLDERDVVITAVPPVAPR